jgi:hypothetical protein
MTVACRGAVSVSRLIQCASLGFLALIVGCNKSTIDNGTPTVTASATNAHFTSFIVNIDSISMTRDDNNVFTALAAVERVDLAHLTDIGELVESPAIPSGTYKQLAITIDYTTTPEITVDQNGQATALLPVDNTGAALLSTQTVTLNLDPNKPLVITKGKSVRLDLHFDLPASTTVDLANKLVTVYPFVVASLTPTINPTLRARGGFLAINAGGNYFIINGRPFIDLASSLGAVQINVAPTTYFDINGTAYTGSAGLTALKDAPVNTTIVAYGSLADLSKVTPIFAATEVYAGTSQETLDHVLGVVAARSGNTLTLRGAELISSLGSESFLNSGTVTLGSSTKVTQDGQPNATGLSLDSISVGQRIDAGGGATTLDSAGNAIIAVDSSGPGGEVRLQSTRLWGTLNSAAAGTADLNLLSIENYSPAAFTFTGTGATADATPADYLLDTGSTTVSAAPGTLLRVDGRVTPFGTAPPDFSASTITPASSTESVLEVEWTGNGTTAPFSSLTSTGLVIDLTNTALGAVHAIETGPTSVDLVTSLPASPTIVPDPNATNFSLGAGSTFSIGTFSTYAGWLSSTQTGLNGTNTVRKFVAVGTYNAATNTFSATRMNLVAH